MAKKKSATGAAKKKVAAKKVPVKKRIPAKNKTRKGTKVNTRSNFGFSKPILIGIFATLIGGGLLLFLINFLQLNDISNNHIEANQKYLRPMQWIIYAGLLVICTRYGLRILQGKLFEKLDWILLGASFVLGIILYTTVLNAGLSDNGDNASYIINAKSLVERGGAYQLNTVGERPDALASLGLPIVLSPVYAIWGMDIFKMKILIWLMALAIFPILFFIFKQLTSELTAAILTIVIFIHPVLFSSCSYVMTETPFMFWATLSTLAIMRYKNATKISIGWLVLSFFSMGMLYLTKAIGAGGFIAAGLYLLVNMPLIQTVKNKSYKLLLKDLSFKKFMWLVLPLVLGGLGFIGYKLSLGGTSQINVISGLDGAKLWDNWWKSYTMTWWILSQIDFFDNTIRYLNFMPDAVNHPLNAKWIGLNLLIILGFIRSILV